MSATIDLEGPSTDPGAPQITPHAVNDAVNAAFAQTQTFTNAAIAAAIVALEDNTAAQIAATQSIATIALATTTDLSNRTIVQIDRWTSGAQYAPARYQKVGSDPGNGAAFQDALGNWFANIEPVVTPEMFGALGQPSGYAGPNYDDPAWQIAIAVQRVMRLMSPTYCLNSAPIIPSRGTLWIETGRADTMPMVYGTISHSFAIGFVDYVHRVYLRGIGFDGGRMRLHGFPYANNAPDTIYTFVAVMDLHADPSDTTSRADIIDCLFQNTHVYSWHLTFFQKGYDLGNTYIRTADHGFIACNLAITDKVSKEWSSDNGVSISRGCLRTTISNSTFLDCEVAGAWNSGFNNAGSGTLTATGTYTILGVITLSSSAGIFDGTLVNTFLTPKGADNKTCVLKVVAYINSTTVTAMVIIGDASSPTTGVPASLQATASTSWQYGPSLGNDEFTVTGNKLIGCYADGFAGLTAARRGEVALNIICRTGLIADSEVSSLGSIAAGDTHITVSASTGSSFPTNSWIIFRPRTSYTDYFIAKVTNQTGDTLTIDRAAPDTYALEFMHLAHSNTGTGFGVPINITGNSVGKHVFASDISVHDNQIIDFVGSAARLGNAGNGGVMRIGVERNKIFQPGNIGDGTSNLILLQEYPGTQSDYICIRDNESDTTTPFVRFSQQGSTPRRVILGPNYVPNASSYFTALDASNRNIDCTIKYLTSYQAPLTDPTGTSATSPGVMMGLGQLRTGVAATGNILFAANPSAAATVTLNGVVWTFVSGASSGTQTTIQGTLAATLTQLAADLMKSTNISLVVANYTSDATHLLVTYGIGGAAGNAYTLAASVATPSAGTLTGGAYDAKPNTKPALLIAQKTGIFDITISGNLINATVGNSMLVHGRYSSAVSAPANGAGPIGTVFCSALEFTTPAAGIRSGFTLSGRAGAPGDPQVPIGSTMWVDLVGVSVAGTLVSPTDIRVTIRELDSDQVYV